MWGSPIECGYVTTLPNPGQLSYDWNLEMWFDSNEEAHEFLSREPFSGLFSQLCEVSSETLAGLFRGQEMLILNTALSHRDE